MSPRLSELFLSSQSDERLVALARAGHERAFVTIVERYGPELQALARRLCADGRGEDVLQQAFLSAFAALRSGAEVKHLRGWLYRIVRNAAHRSRSPVFVPLDGATASAETIEDVVQERALAMTALTELARLPARQRQAMVGTVGGMARSEVASTMGLSEGAVRQLVHRARSTLRTAVTAVTPWPMARWFAAFGQSTPGSAELGAGAGAASSGGIALKLGALVASGTLATGVAAVDLHGARPHAGGARPATPGHTHASTRRPVPLAAVADPSVALAAASPQHPTSASIIEASRTSSRAGAVAIEVGVRRGRHAPPDGRSATRPGGSGRSDGGSRRGDGASSGSDGGSRGSDGGHDGSGGGGSAGSSQSGHGDSSPTGSGSALPAGGSGQDSGTAVGVDSGSGSAQPSGSIAAATERGDHGQSLSSDSRVLGTDGGGGSGSGSSDGGHFGSGSSSGSASSIGSASSSGSASTSAAGSSSGSGLSAGDDATAGH
jgi:RNA polymerase sigma factor (sigma-70 family)